MNCERAIDHVIDQLITHNQMPFDPTSGISSEPIPVPSHGKPLYSCPFRNEPDACCRINREKQNRKDKQ